MFWESQNHWFCDIGFKSIRQKGSHVFMLKETQEGKKFTVVPLHDELDKGTLLEIIRQIGMEKEEFIKML
ncbi:MAG: type II toxin-antitoxin system HicA family toxin [Candidatus Pacearchaeota archaeon]|nr:type II toxin-antitoxin system HicA family toxin [Candidatus Pacearchaeota archaeon]